jgi:DNA-directed RNA polymerase subunit RPC12/RpoP
MAGLPQEEFIKAILKVIDRWSFEQCAFCEDGTMVSIEGMVDYKCTRCGKTMNPVNYLVEIAKIVFNFREQIERNNEKTD